MRTKTALTALLLSLCLTAAVSGQSASREILVSRFGSDPSVALTGEGNLVVAWQRFNDVFAQLFGRDGRPAGPVLTVSNDFGEQLFPRVAADARGNFVVAWQGGSEAAAPGVPGGDGQGTGIFLQLFNRSGKRVGPARIANRRIGGFQTNPDVAMRPDGSFLIAWDQFFHGSVGELRAQVFAPTGIRRGPELEIPLEKQTIFPKKPVVTAGPEGFAVGWTETESCTTGIEQSPVIARVSPSGRLFDPFFRLTDHNCDGTGWFLRGLASGESGSVALFRGQRNSVQLFEPSGEAADPRKVVGQREPCSEGACETVLSVAMDNSGRFAVIWALELDVPSSPEGDRYPPRYTLLAQFFDLQGQPLGERFQVSGALARFEPRVATALSDDGSLVVVWNRNGAMPEKSGIFLRRFTID